MADGLTSWQKFQRFLWGLVGPAQTGLPPYATPEERDQYRAAHAPRTPTPSTPPAGYRFKVYTDLNGAPRRALVPIDPAAPTDPAAPSGR